MPALRKREGHHYPFRPETRAQAVVQKGIVMTPVKKQDQVKAEQRLTVYRRDGKLFLQDCNGKLIRVLRHQLRSYLRSECQISRAEAEAMIDAAQEFTKGEYVERTN